MDDESLNSKTEQIFDSMTLDNDLISNTPSGNFYTTCIINFFSMLIAMIASLFNSEFDSNNAFNDIANNITTTNTKLYFLLIGVSILVTLRPLFS